MALQRVLIDPYTRSELARPGMEELSRNLWPERCQSCGEDLGQDSPAVVAADHITAVTITLHHPQCQRPRWTRHGSDLMDRYLSTSTALTGVPFGDPARDPIVPTMLINPSMEQVALAVDESGQYRATTVASYRPLGLLPAEGPVDTFAVGDGETVCCWVTDDAIIVRCDRDYWRIAAHPENPWLDDIRGRGYVVLGMSTALNPVALGNPEPLKRVLRAGDLAVIQAPLNTTAPPPTIDTGAVRTVDWEPVAGDEHDDAAWLPEITYYSGPSYSADTGTFESGIGMDGPRHWRLNTPGAGTANGLAAGAEGLGKTNFLRIVVVEAASSGRFCVTAADPADRGGLAGFAEHFSPAQLPPARGVDETRQLLGALAAMVEFRTSAPQDYTTPTSEFPGVLLALDDGDVVLSDRATADLAAYVATQGPQVCVSLVVASRSLELDDYARRTDLLQALIAHPENFVVFGGHKDALRIRAFRSAVEQ